ncbi:MAG TPA: NADH-quinone oxidoreductase subunit M, partial [Thermoanaerobaculia bacterium]
IPIGMLASANLEKPKAFTFWMLILEMSVIGVFLALDTIVFFVFFELVLVPMYFLIAGWGHGNRRYAATKFFLYTMTGSAFLFVGVLSVAFLHQHATGHLTFDVRTLTAWSSTSSSMSLTTAKWLFVAFAIGFAVKVPLVPFHTWLPDAHTDAPTAGSVVLAGVMLKMGTYGFLRFVLPFFPEASAKWTWLLIALSVIGIIYGALVAWVQPDMKKLVAYSSVSHLGFCVLGIFALNQTSIEGSILQMVNHGLSTGALFLLVGVIYERRHTRLLADYGGLAETMPVYAVLFIIAMLSSVGLPGLNGFIGEFLILSGTFQTHPIAAVLAATGVILAAIYLLWLVQKVFYGPMTNQENKHVPEIAWNEVAALVPLIVLMVWIGVHPNTFLKRMSPSVQELISVVKQEKSGHVMEASAGGVR